MLFAPSAAGTYLGRAASFYSTPSVASLISIPRLAGTQQQQHLHLHLQECGSAAAAPARMRRVPQTTLHVFSSKSCDYVISVSVVCAMIRVCVSVSWNPTFSAFCFFCSACCCLQLRTLLLCVCGPLLCICGHDVCVYVLCECARCTYSHGATAINQHVCVDHFHACVDIA